MFTTGFDLGSENCVIAVARKGGIDIIANEASYRTTPALVTFAEEQRYIGQSAQAQFKRNVAATVTNVKRIIGRRFDEEDIQKELPFLAYKIKPIDDSGAIGIELRQDGEMKTFTPVQICGALLGQLKRTAEESLGQEVRDVVIGVPGWFNDAQRRALLDAASVAGLHCLQLVNELTACALELGIRKDRQLAQDENEVVVFFDMGATQTQCSVMRYSKGKLEVLGYGYNQHLGGRNFTAALVEHFRQEWIQKYKIDIAENPRAKLRTTEACQKLKHVLSANTHGNVNLECLMQDKDVSGKLERDVFVGMVQPLLEQTLGAVEQALASAGISREQVGSVEVVGDSHRIPAVAEQLASFFGKAPSKRTNATEVVAKGSAWQCARRSPLFKVMPYELKDCQSYPVNFQWRWSSDEGEGTSSAVFPPNSAVPLFKRVTFKKRFEKPGMTFTASAAYAEGAAVAVPAGTATHIGKWTISDIPEDRPNMVADEKAELKVGCKLDESGVVLVSRAEKEWKEEIEYEEEQEVPLSEEEVAAAAAAAGDDKTEAPAEEEKKKEEEKKEGEEEKKDEEKKEEPAAVAKQPQTKKIKVTKKRVQARSQKLVVVAETASLSEAEVKRLTGVEAAMRAHDNLVVATAAEKNKVESYVYEARDKLSTTWTPFATEEDRAKLSSLCESTESWLYEEGDSETKDVYSAKLAELKALGEPMEVRAREAEERPPAIDALRNEVRAWVAWAEGSDPAFAHISAEEKESVKTKANEALAWLEGELKQQEATAVTAPPAVLSTDILARRDNLRRDSNTVRHKAKPKAPEPKKEEEKKPEEKKEETKEEAKEEKKDDGEAKPMDTAE